MDEGRTRVVCEIARGGMAVVHAVRRSSIGGFERLFAMKSMLPHLAGDEHFVRMFLDEAKIAARIQHGNVAQVLDVGRRDGVPFILMELVRGQSLAVLAQRCPDAPPAHWLAILAQAAEGLHAAHETLAADGGPLGVVHRDVSPQNILVGYDGRVRVVDFGIAAARGRLAGTRTGELKGKFAYLAPEQVTRDRALTRTVDVWALGVVAWELFAKRRLFAADEEATALWNVMSAGVPDIRSLAPELPETAARAVMSALERQPARRTQTAAELARAFAAAARELGGGAAADLAAWMEERFAVERAAEEARFAGTPEGAEDVGAPEGSPTAAPAATESTQLSTVGPRDAPRRGRGSRWAAFVLALGALGGGAWLAVRAITPEPRSTAGAAASGAAPSATAPSASVTLHVAVDEAAKLVLIDGVRHDERPLAIALPAGGRAAVEIVMTDGRIVHHDVGEADEGTTLAVPAPSGAPSASAAAVRGKKPANPLLRNPF